MTSTATAATAGAAALEQAHDRLLNHIMARANCCYAPAGRYCATGAELKEAYHQAFAEWKAAETADER